VRRDENESIGSFNYAELYELPEEDEDDIKNIFSLSLLEKLNG
jgi:hypothetical protein